MDPKIKNNTTRLLKIVYAIFSGSDRLGGITEFDLAKHLKNEGFNIDRRQLRICLDDGRQIGLFVKKANNCYRLTKPLYDSLAEKLEAAKRKAKTIKRRIMKQRKHAVTVSSRSRGRLNKKRKTCSECLKKKSCKCPSNCSLCPRTMGKRNRERMKRKLASGSLATEETITAKTDDQQSEQKKTPLGDKQQNSEVNNKADPTPANGNESLEHKIGDPNKQP